jgi:AbrB family looped-hinge helix DNA binding protein
MAQQTQQMFAIVKDLTTVSDKIRALNEAGVPRAEIARFLGKRYQHVRNVLVADSSSGRSAGNSNILPQNAGPAAFIESKLKGRLQVGAGGRIVIPSEMRSAMGIAEGDSVLARVLDGELRLVSQATAVHKAQQLVRRYVPEDVSLVDQLLEERRAEAAKDRGA